MWHGTPYLALTRLLLPGHLVLMVVDGLADGQVCWLV